MTRKETLLVSVIIFISAVVWVVADIVHAANKNYYQNLSSDEVRVIDSFETKILDRLVEKFSN